MAEEKKEWYSMTEAERKFADVIWENEPVGSGELVRLCEQGLFENRDSRVSAKIDRESYDQHRGERFVQETYGGSLPKMIAAFISRKKLSRQQVDEIKQMIDNYKE